MKKQTAVEWLAHAIIDADESFFRTLTMDKQREMKGIYEQAKAMEKEQVEQAYSDGLGNGMHYERGDATESVLNEVMYYKQTYGGTNE
jgi:hypothetical protein